MKSLLTDIISARLVLTSTFLHGATGAEDATVALCPRRHGRHWLGLMLVICGLLAPRRALAKETWTALAQAAPVPISQMLLLADGTVMAQNGGDTGWYRLRPDIHGSYVNGTWSTLASMHDSRLYYSSVVLRDGRVFIAGAEYGSGTNTAEVYDPVSDTWTLAPASGQVFLDSVSEILPNGNVLVAPVFPSADGGTVIYNPTSDSWSAGPTLFRGYNQDEASWVKLPDDSILTIDPFDTSSERYIPSLNQWVDDGVVPVSLYSTNGELGAAFLLPDGRAFFLGATGHTALYTPTGTISPGTWAAGPDIPNGQGTSDAPAAMMVNGKILCAVGPAQTFDSPTRFDEYDRVANTFTSVKGPTGLTYPTVTYATRMLDLPDGTVLFSSFSSQLYVYHPDGSPLAAGKPAINSITPNADGSYLLTGTLLNGISEGAGYGDDAQMNSNYPIVRMTDSAGIVYYARTYNWSSTGVMTGNTPSSTQFMLPGGLPAGTYSLVVAANGISSDPVPFFTPDLLQITLMGGGNQVLLSWPSSALSAVLETTADLSSGNWAAITAGVTMVGSNFVCTNSTSTGRAFFRLHGH